MKMTQSFKLLPSLIVLMRILFGIGWFLAGVTKITEKHWFTEPGVFLREYLLDSLGKSNVPTFYKIFLEHVALEHVMVLNYAIPIVQIALGILLITGLFTMPSILICLFMHINFILSGNINVMSLILYTSAFSLIVFRANMYHLSLDKYWNLEILPTNHENKRKTTTSMSSHKERLFSNS